MRTEVDFVDEAIYVAVLLLNASVMPDLQADFTANESLFDRDTDPLASLERIDQLLKNLDDFADQISDPLEFHRKLLSRTVASLAADSGAIWRRHANELQCECAIPASDLSRSEQLGLEQLVADVAVSSQHLVHQLESEKAQLFLQPINENGQVIGVLELAFGANDVLEAAAVIQAVSEVIADYHARRETDRLREANRCASSIDAFTRNLYREATVQSTAMALANAGRQFIGCDRLTVLVHDGSVQRVEFVSGVDSVNRRSMTIRNMERLVNEVVRCREDFWFDGDISSLPPNIESCVRSVVDSNHVRRLGVLPIPCGADDHESRMPIGAFVIENFDSDGLLGELDRAEAVRTHASVALQRAEEIQQVPFWNLWQALRIQSFVKRTPKLLISLILALVLLAVLFVVPMDFHVTASGTLQPKQRQDVFAPIEGKIVDVLVSHGEKVQANQPLIKIESPALQSKFHRLTGELKAVREKLLQLQSVRMEGHRQASSQRYRDAAEERALAETQAGLEMRLELIEEQLERCTLVSPFQGEVASWDVARRLQLRPVNAGDVLLTVADTDSDWELLVHVPDHSVGYITHHRQSNGGNNRVQFALESNVAEKFSGELVDLSPVTDSDVFRGNIVHGMASFDRSQLDSALRPGVPARVKIHCGKRSLAFIWFHEAINSLRSYFLY